MKEKENSFLLPDNSEVEKVMKKNFMHVLLNSAFASVAPYLFLSRQVDEAKNVGVSMQTLIKDVLNIPQKVGNVLRVKLETNISAEGEVKRSEIIMYMFKGTGSDFEPFVLINRTEKDGSDFFAYATETQFLVDILEEKNDQANLKQIYSKVKEKEMKILMRYVNLLINSFR